MSKFLVLGAIILSMNAIAEERREVATEDATPVEDARSFFEPKTEADLVAIATLGQDLERDLGQENLN